MHDRGEAGTAPERTSRGTRPFAPPDRAIWIDGRIVRGRDAVVSLHDRGAHDGQGLFETVRIEGGRPHHWTRHLERLIVAAAELGFPVPPGPAVLSEALREVLQANDLADAAARITVTRGIPGGRPTRAGCWVEAEPLAGRLWRGTRSGRATAVVSGMAFSPGPIGRFKTTSRLAYTLALEEARAASADECLLASGEGEVLEGAVSNVFAVVSGQLVTPPLASGILPGIVRSRVLALCAQIGVPVRERRLMVSELAAAEEILLTNSIQQVVPLASLDGRAVPSQTLGTRLRDVYRARLDAAAG